MSPTPFMGNNEEVFKVSDGSIWQVMYEYEYLYEYYPLVIICEAQGFMIVGDKKLSVARLSGTDSTSNAPGGGVIESTIAGEFDGWDGDTVVLLDNGQIWQQVEYYYEYMYAYRPSVTIFQRADLHYMVVEGIGKPIGVMRLK